MVRYHPPEGIERRAIVFLVRLIVPRMATYTFFGAVNIHG